MHKKSLFNVMALTAAIAAVSISAEGAYGATPAEITIEAKPLDLALNDLAQQLGVQITVFSDDAAQFMSKPLSGQFSSDEAVQFLISGSGLEYRRVNDDMIAVGSPERLASTFGQGQQQKEKEGKKAELEEIIVTASKRETRLQDTALSISALGSDAIDKRGLVQMDDYMNTIPGVTMQERGGTGNTIVMRGISVNHGDEAVGVYFGETPVSGGMGATWGSGTYDFKMVDIERVEVLRGPQGTLFGSGSMGGTVRILPAAPNLQEVEGKVSAGYSLTDKAGGDNSELRGVFNLPLVEDKLAVRGVAYRFDDSGYVDNIAASYTGPWGSAVGVNTRDTFGDTAKAWGADVRDQSERGSIETTGARFSMLWQPTENFSANLSYAWQKAEGNAWPDVDLSLPGKFQQTRVAPSPNSNLLDGPDFVNGGNGIPIGAEGFYSELDTYALTLDYDLGWGTLHSSSAWLKRDAWSNEDLTKDLPQLGVYFSRNERSTDRFFQEVRFASNFDGPFQVLAGLYYEDIDNRIASNEAFGGDPDQLSNFLTTALDNSYGIPAGTHGWPEFYWFLPHWDDALEQKAAFGEVSWDILDNLTGTVGMRHYEYDQTNYQTLAGFWWDTVSEQVYSNIAGDNKGETYKANLSWKPSDDTLVYFQWAEGFRPGMALGIQDPRFDPDGTGFYTTIDGVKIPIANSTDPDTLENIELGFKGSFADGRIDLAASIYHISWEGLPVGVTIVALDGSGTVAGTTVNAGESTSEGIELEAHFLLADSLSLDLATSWNETKLAKDQAALGKKGDDLPNSADVNFSAGLEYGFALSGYDAFVRADYAYVGSYDVYLKNQQAADVPTVGGYGQINLKGGVNMGAMDISLYVRNLTNADEITWVSNGWVKGGPEAFRLRPRTIGMGVSYRF